MFRLRNWPLFAFLGLLVLSLVLRVVFLRTAPPYFSHDEVHYVSEAKSLAVSGKDLTGTWQPWHLKPSNPLYAELPSTLMVPAAFFFADPFWAARITFVVLGLLFPFVLGGIAWKLTDQKMTFWTTAAIALFNPWVFEFSRTSFDALASVFFYSLGILCLIAGSRKWRMIGLLPLLIGFFQYQGLKIVFVPIIFLTVAYMVWTEWEKKPKEKLVSAAKRIVKAIPDVLVVGLLCLGIFGWYVTQLSSQSAGQRVNDLIFFNEDFLAQRVNEQRRISLLSPLMSLTANKLTVIAQEFFIKYAQTFSPAQLFMHGESVRSPFTVWTLGFFHPIDAVLIALGFAGLIMAKKWRKELLLLVCFALIAPLPVAVNSIDTWTLFRGSWLIVVGLVVAGIGAWWVWQNFPKIVGFCLLGIYAVFVGRFLHEYFFRYPIYSTRGTPFAERVIANYAQRVPSDTKILVLADEARFVFQSYLSYNPQLITPENMPAIQQAMQNSVYTLGNITFATDCLDLAQATENTVIINSGVNITCDKKPVTNIQVPYAKIPSLLDNGVLFTVYNDKVCNAHVLQPYLHLTDRTQLDVERLDQHKFCESLFSKPIE